MGIGSTGRCALALALAAAGGGRALANPYPDERAVPKVPAGFWLDGAPNATRTADEVYADARSMLRVRLDWQEAADTFTLGRAVIEPSGTDALLARAARPDALGSYRGILADAATGRVLAYDALGTGQEFRRLTRALTLRFPAPDAPVDLTLVGENPRTGRMEEMLRVRIDPAQVERAMPARALIESGALEVRQVKAATQSPKLVFNVYADGYTEAQRATFFADAQRVLTAFQGVAFPGLARFEINAVFMASSKTLGTAQDLGLPVAERDSFLGLYYPYWRDFGRWYDVVYPTREEKFRAGLALAPYDHPVVLLNSSEYFGVGNFRELTAIPARSSSFAYLLLHEIGHYFGLNEEYETGGPTELAFAPETFEPWSQNITFLRDPAALKWKELVARTTPVPTPSSAWRGNGPYGAYPGGYAETEPFHASHKPGMACTMNTSGSYCPVCARALEARMAFDSGL